MRYRPASPALVLSAFLFNCTETAPPPHVAPPMDPATASVASKPTGPCALHGVVTAESGAPVEGALVAAIPPAADTALAIAYSDREGRYCFPSLNTGVYGFTITAKGQTAAYLDVRDVATTPPNKATIDVRVGGPGFTLRGLVVDNKGAPLPGVHVHATRLGIFLADIFIAESGADGRYEVKLPANNYAPVARSETYLSSPTTVELSKDQSIDITAQRLHGKSSPAPDSVVAWIKQKAIPLATTEPGTGLDDMSGLKAIVGDARLVGMGEATHGTREFFQLKHRMLEFLVETMGFRSFGIEASFGTCLPLTEYVRTGEGDPAAALANQGIWAWDTEEVLAVVKWMRAYNENKAHTQKLSFWGFDMQSPTPSAHAVEAYFEEVDQAFAKEIGPGLAPVDNEFVAHKLNSIPAAAQQVADLAMKIVAKLDAERARYVKKKAGERGFLLARIHARVVADYALLAKSGDASGRDRSMADIAAALLEVEDLGISTKGAGGAGAKIMLWGHNGHINKHDNGGSPSMGSHLAKRFGAGYLALGFSFDEGSFQAIDIGTEERGLIPFTVPSAPPGSLDHTLARAGIPLFALDLRGAPAGPVADWLSIASYSRSPGSVFDDKVVDFALYPIIPTAHFDGLFFVKKSTAAHPKETAKSFRNVAKRGTPAAIPDPSFEVLKKGDLPSAFWRVATTPRQLEYRATVTDVKCASGKQCLVVERTKGTSPNGYTTTSIVLDPIQYRGRRLHVSASVRVEVKDPKAKAYLFGATSLDSWVWAQAPGASWTKVNVNLNVPADADGILIGLAVAGAAAGFIDDIEVSSAP